MKKFLKLKYFVLLFQAIVSFIITTIIKDLDILPENYFTMLIGALCVLWIVIFLMYFIKNKYANLFNHILSLVLSIVMIMGCIYVYEGVQALDSMTGHNTEETTTSIITLKAEAPTIGTITGMEESTAVQEITKIEQLEGKKVGVLDLINFDESSILQVESEDSSETQLSLNIIKALDKTEFALDLIYQEYGYDINNISYTSFDDLIHALYTKEVDAIILTEVFRDYVLKINNKFTRDTNIVEQLIYNSEILTNTEEVNVTKDCFTIYISGVDYYGKIYTRSRSDVNMVVTINPVTHQVLLTSIPRDYYVTLHTYGKKDKLTHAGVYGVGESLKTIEDLLGIKIDYYARLNFSSLTAIIDAIGGVTVWTDYNFTARDDYYNYYTFKKGWNEVNGKKALVFARERSSFRDGDLVRGQHQQALIKAIIDKVLSPAIITQYTEILASVEGKFQTSVPMSDITRLVKRQLDTMPSWEILNYQLKGYGDSQYTYSYAGQRLYVMQPYQEYVDYATKIITQMENHEVITLDDAPDKKAEV